MPYDQNSSHDSWRAELKKPDRLQELAEFLVSYGEKNGADEVEVTALESNEYTLNIRLNEIENLVEASSRTIALKVIKDNRSAIATSSALQKETLQRLVQGTLQRALLASPDEFSGLPDPPAKEIASLPLDLYDPQVCLLDPETKINLALETERIALRDKRITNSHGASLETREIKSVISNSKGFSGMYEETLCGLGVGLQAGETDEKVEGFWNSTKRHFKDLDSPEKIAQKAVERTVRQLNPRKIQTQNIPVIFEPEMTSWLLGFLFSCVSGISVYNRISFLADKLGEKIGNDLITVFDDGLMPKKLGSAPFDSEGVPSQKTIVCEKGSLKNFLCNTYAARKLNLASTGNATGNGVGPNNFYLQRGKTSPEEMILTLEKGLILTRVLGHGLNPVTGDISRGAFGLWVENGQILYPVSEITVSGNLGKILNAIEMVGNDLDFRSAVSGPTIKIQELTVAGQ